MIALNGNQKRQGDSVPKFKEPGRINGPFHADIAVFWPETMYIHHRRKSCLFVCRRQLDVRPVKEVAQISNGQTAAERHAHFPGHDDEAHVPSERSDDE